MPIGAATPRDKFDQLMAFIRRMFRYWWLVAIMATIGGVLSVLLALYTKPRYLSEAKVFYNERIQSSILQGRNSVVSTKNLGTQYSEMLMSRTNMVEIIEKLGLFSEIVEKQGVDAALLEFKKMAMFRVRGTGMFHVSYQSHDPEEAQEVTSMMVESLISEDRRLRRESASATMNFLLEEKAKVNKELVKRQRELAAFLAEHPEFALDAVPGGTAAPGASIRAQAQNKTGGDTSTRLPANTDPRLLALERQRRRIKNRLDAPDDVDKPQPKTPEQIEAERLVDEAQRELRRAESDLQEKLSRFTAAHPDVIRAQRRVADTRAQVARARADVPPSPPKNAPIDRTALQEELSKIEREIASVKATMKPDEAETVTDEDSGEQVQEDNWVVALETEFVRISQEVAEQRNRLERLDNSLTNAEITASQQMAEQGAVLTIIDPPNLPTLPQGKGRMIIAAAGTAVFIILGVLLALAVALVDDRIYRGGDLEKLAIAPVAVVVPKHRKRGLLKRMFRRG